MKKQAEIKLQYQPPAKDKDPKKGDSNSDFDDCDSPECTNLDHFQQNMLEQTPRNKKSVVVVKGRMQKEKEAMMSKLGENLR